jgi:hypothetical protein
MLDGAQSLVLASIPDDAADPESDYSTSQLEMLTLDTVMQSLDNMDWTPLDLGDDSGRVDDSFLSHGSPPKTFSASDSRLPMALRSPARPSLSQSTVTLPAPRAVDNRRILGSSVAARDGRAPAATLGAGAEPRLRGETKSGVSSEVVGARVH